jgi:lipoprotein-anchoring transpeptidase ErfK/SrfK
MFNKMLNKMLKPTKLITVIMVALGLSAISAPLASARVPEKTATATLLFNHRVYPYPDGGKVIRTLPARTPLTHSPTTTPILATATAHGVEWVRVELPGRPNGSTGWISTNGLRLGSTRYLIIVDRAHFQATLYRSGKVWRRFPVIVGKPSTPTPAGDFYIEEVLHVGSGVAGPFVLATSARSNVLQDFDGGPGQIGLHGRNGLPDPISTASSHGCVRFLDQDIAWLVQVARVGAGVPVDIH